MASSIALLTSTNSIKADSAVAARHLGAAVLNVPPLLPRLVFRISRDDIIRDLEATIAKLESRIRRKKMATKLWKKKYELMLVQHENEKEELRLEYEKRHEKLRREMAKDADKRKGEHEFLQERYRKLVVKHCAMLIPDRVMCTKMPKLSREQPQEPSDIPPNLYPRGGCPFGYPSSSPRGGAASSASTSASALVLVERAEDKSRDQPSSSAVAQHGRAKKDSRSCTCGQHFQSMAALDRHLLEKVRMRLECALCCDVFHSRADAVTHMEDHGAGGKKPLWICTQCDIFFPSRESFKEHQDLKERDKRCIGKSLTTAC